MRNTFTQDEDNFLICNYMTMPIKAMSKAINRSSCGVIGRMKKLSLIVPHEIIEQRKLESRIQPGAISANKGKKQTEYMSPEAIAKTALTRFKKGNTPHNTKFDGFERISKDGYIEIRVAKGRFRLKHRLEWEKVNGEIPAGSIIVCKGDNIKDCNPDNWELITMRENMDRNSGAINLPDSMIATYLASSSRKVDKRLKTELLKHPELLQAKRAHILLNRKINNHGQK
jgi:hypothetical protein